MIKAQVTKLLAKQAALWKIRQRLGVQGMTDSELVELANELRSAEIPAWVIAHLTDLKHNGDTNGKDKI